MIKNYLKIAWRNLLKHKTFSVINIVGLAIGISACMIIFVYVHHELTFDQYNLKADRIARVTLIMHAPESDLTLATAPTPMAEALVHDYPEVESTVRLEPSPQTIKSNNDFLREENVYKTDQSIFSIFSFEFLEGNPAGALQKPGTIVITNKIRKKYFGTNTALGKTLRCNGDDLLVTAVVKDRPSNSDMNIDALLSTDFSKTTKWVDDFSCYLFVLFHKKPDLKNFEQKLVAMSTSHVQPELDAMDAKQYKVQFQLEALDQVHFSEGKLADFPKGNKQYSYIFSILAVFILLIALLNYINLSTAKSAERAKEVGIRKVSGAHSSQLVTQFLFEAFLLITIAWISSIVLVQLSLPFVNRLLQTTLTINWTYEIIFAGAIFIVTFLLAGLYPAFVLTAFKPVQVLKGNWKNTSKGVWLRKLVTVIQFSIAAALIMGTVIIYNQLHFIEKKNLGYNRDQLLNIYLPNDSVYRPAATAFQNALRQRPEINGVTVGSGMTSDGLTVGTTIAETEGKKREAMCNYYSIDENFLSVFQIQLAEGRNFSKQYGTDKKEGFIVNEAFVKLMGWKSALGKSVEGWGHKGKVIGVVKNFYYRSLHNMVEPLLMVCNDFPTTTTIKIKPHDLPIVKELFKNSFPSMALNYSFFDEIINKQYEKDRITMSLFNDFTILAVLVSCLGLYGLVSLIATQRTKEIGIRKVLGASLSQLISLMSKDFIKLVCWALVIALPVAGFFMNKWLTSYAYHIGISWWMFLIPAGFVLVITIAVVSREIIKTALINPAKTLRAE